MKEGGFPSIAIAERQVIIPKRMTDGFPVGIHNRHDRRSIMALSTADFVKSYVSAKSMPALLKTLGAGWDEKKVCSKVSALRTKGLPIKTPIQQGLVEEKKNGGIDLDALTALLGEKAASGDELPKKRNGN